MKTILTINKPLSYPKEVNHPCLMSLELDKPISRINAPASIMQLEAGNNVIQCDRIRPPFLRANRNTLFRVANENSFVTILDGYDDIIRYDLVEVKDDDAWTLVQEDDCEFVVVAQPDDIVEDKDVETGYCTNIQPCVTDSARHGSVRVGNASW